MPWDTLAWDPSIHLGLFVHRVDGIEPGLYLLARNPGKMASLKGAMHQRFAWTRRRRAARPTCRCACSRPATPESSQRS